MGFDDETDVTDVRRLNIGKVKGTLINFNELENILDNAAGFAPGAVYFLLLQRNTQETLPSIIPVPR